MSIDLSLIRNPIFDRDPAVSARDPAVIRHDGAFHCFHTAFERREGTKRAYVDVCSSVDLISWGGFRRLTSSRLNFSSPGNVFRVEDTWLMCVQSYPIPEGSDYGSEDSRLWLMESRDLVSWTEPRVMKPEGCTGRWTPSRRQIDPYVIPHDGRFWCLCKTSGSIGLLVSDDLRSWEEASPDRPILSPAQTPDGSTVENPCVIRHEGRFVMFFAPCREGRGIGFAESGDLLDWSGVRYLRFPELPWASGGPTAPVVLDARLECGKWLMFFHGDRPGLFGAAMGVAWSDDLEDWTVPGS